MISADKIQYVFWERSGADISFLAAKAQRNSAVEEGGRARTGSLARHRSAERLYVSGIVEFNGPEFTCIAGNNCQGLGQYNPLSHGAMHHSTPTQRRLASHQERLGNRTSL